MTSTTMIFSQRVYTIGGETMIDRREALQRLGGLLGAAAVSRGLRGAEESPATTQRLGLVTYCCRFRREWLRRLDMTNDLFQPLAFLEHCRSLGAGGMQIGLGDMSDGAAEQLRHRLDETGMYLDAIISLPRETDDVARFDREMRTAVIAGADAVRTVMFPGRRYEQFHSLEEFREYEARGRRMLELATPIAEKHQLPLAVDFIIPHLQAQRVEQPRRPCRPR